MFIMNEFCAFAIQWQSTQKYSYNKLGGVIHFYILWF
jgi:hypothetical protein